MAGLDLVEVRLVGGQDPLTLFPDCVRLVSHDPVEPLVRVLGVELRAVPQERLERPLVGVLGVVRTERIPAGDSQQGVRVVLDRRDHEGLGLRGAARGDIGANRAVLRLHPVRPWFGCCEGVHALTRGGWSERFAPEINSGQRQMLQLA